MSQQKKFVKIDGVMKINPEWKATHDGVNPLPVTTIPGDETPYLDSAGQETPQKFIAVGGVMKLNPEYKKWKESNDGGVSSASPVTTVKKPDVALPVISSIDDYKRLKVALEEDIALSESTTATIEMMHEPEMYLKAGMQPDDMFPKLSAILDQFEVPMGLMNKLMMLSEFERLEFMIDDSRSMRNLSDAETTLNQEPTRWVEAYFRLREILEILAYVPFQQIVIEFLNRPDRISITKEGRAPEAFLRDVVRKIDKVFAFEPEGTTPALERLQDSINKASGSSVAFFFFGDGLPNGGKKAQRGIIELLLNRPNPSSNPITFISCTDEDWQIEWMKDAEEVVPFCSESDDFNDEAEEVLKDQGPALPYTKGFHLICQLVAAMNPHDLDAMDESVPFTKAMLDNLLGVQHNEVTYRHYFNNLLEAQRKRRIRSKADRLRKNTHWNIEDFIKTKMSHDIPQVQEFKRELAEINRNHGRGLSQYDLNECCSVS